MPSFDEIVDDLVQRHPHVARRKMWGMPSFTANGKAAGGLWSDDMVFKLTGAEARERALALPGAHRFAPIEGREMKEWVVVPQAQSEHWPELAETAVARE